MKILVLILYSLLFGCQAKKSGTTSIGSTSQATIQAPKVESLSSISDTVTSTNAIVDSVAYTTPLPKTSTKDGGGAPTSSNSQMSSASETQTNAMEFSNLNQLDFFNVIDGGGMAGQTGCQSNEYIFNNTCRIKDYIDIASGNNGLTCLLRGVDGTVHCQSILTTSANTYIDPWNKAPYQAGSLTVGHSHVCAKSIADNTYYCWGTWDYSENRSGSDSNIANFWTAYSCNTIRQEATQNWVTVYQDFLSCKASRPATGSSFYATGDTDCEVINYRPVCVGTKTIFSATDLATPFISSGYASKTVAHGCMIHLDGSLTCTYNDTPYRPQLRSPTGTLRPFQTTRVVTSEKFGCASISSTTGGPALSELGCWWKGSGTVSSARYPNGELVPEGEIFKIEEGNFSSNTWKANGYVACGLYGEKATCWTPLLLSSGAATFALPSVVTGLSVGNTYVNTYDTTYVCTLDGQATAVCQDALGGTPTRIQL